MRRLRPAVLFLLGTAMPAALAIAWASSAGAAQPTVDLVAVDMKPSGNTATVLGTIDGCTEADIGSTLAVDVVVDEVPSATMTAFQFDLLYDNTKVTITGVDNKFLLAANGDYNPVDFTDPVPDSDKAFTVADVDFGNQPGETGPGVLSRITVRTIAKGLTTLILRPTVESLLILPPSSEPMKIKEIRGGVLAIDESCAGAKPPVATPISTPPADGVEPGATTQPGPDRTPGTADDTPAPGTGGETPGPGQDGSPSAGGTPGPGPDGIFGTADDTPEPSSGTPTPENAEDDDGGFSAWLLIPIIGGPLLLLGGGLTYWWRLRARAP